MSSWTSVQDELPPIGIEVIVFRIPCYRRPEGQVSALRRCVAHEGSSDFWWDNIYGSGNWHRGDQISHWMSLPAPPIAAPPPIQ